MKPVPNHVKSLALGIVALLVGIQIPTWISVVPSPRLERQADFRVLYTAGYMVRTGQSRTIYDYPLERQTQARVIANDGAAVPFIHPAYETLLFVTLSRFSYHVAYLIWVGINCGLMLLICKLLRPKVDTLTNLFPALPAALLLSFFPMTFAIMQGQDSLLLLLTLILAYRNIADHDLRAGLWMGLGMFRFQVLLPILALFLVWRAWKFLLGCFLTSCGLSAISLIIAGFRAQAQYYQMLQALAALPFLQLTNRMVNIRALVTAGGGGAVVTVAISALVLIAAAWCYKLNVEKRLLLSIVVSSLVAYHFFLHDLCVLILPIMIALNDAVAAKEWTKVVLLWLVICLPILVWFTHISIYIMVIGTLILLAQSMKARPDLKMEMQEEAL